MCMCVVLARFLDAQTGFLDPLSRFLCIMRQETFPGHIGWFPVPHTQKMYELICAKLSIFPPKMAQETIQYGQEMSHDAQET